MAEFAVSRVASVRLKYSNLPSTSWHDEFRVLKVVVVEESGVSHEVHLYTNNLTLQFTLPQEASHAETNDQPLSVLPDQQRDCAVAGGSVERPVQAAAGIPEHEWEEEDGT